MRITEGIVAGRSLADLQRANSAVAKSSQQVSTGKQILRPSDDPLGTQKALNLRGELAATDQYISNANGSLGWAHATDDALGGTAVIPAQRADFARIHSVENAIIGAARLLRNAGGIDTQDRADMRAMGVVGKIVSADQ